MSHAATNWAIRQRGLKPAAKIVLWQLADCHNGHTGQCNPRQDRLADLCEMSRASLNSHLADLEKRGLIQRLKSVDPDRKTQLPTAYILAFTDDEKAVSKIRTQTQDVVPPCPDIGPGAVSKNEPKPCPKKGESRVQNLDTIENPGIEPGREPVNAQERESEVFPLALDMGTDFEDFWTIVPRKVGKDAARKAFANASKKADAPTLFSAMARYAEDRNGKDQQYTVHPSRWLNEGRWQDERPTPGATDFHNQVSQMLKGPPNGLSNSNAPDHRTPERLSSPVSPTRSSGR